MSDRQSGEATATARSSGAPTAGEPAQPPLKVLLVIDHVGTGGAQRQMVTLAIELARRGHAVDLFCYHAAEFFVEQLRQAGVNLRLHAKASRYSARPVLELRRLMRDEAYDVVLSYLPVPSLYTVLASRGLRRRPAVIVSSRTGVEMFRIYWRYRLLKYVYPWADHLVLNSHHLRDFFAERSRWARTHTSVIWNGVALERFRYAPPPERGGELKLLGVGNTAYHKNWMCLVEALALLRKRGVPVSVSLASRNAAPGSMHYEEQEKMKAALARLGVAEHWHWLGERSDVEQLLAEHHALAHPSYLEGLPNVVCESLACGRPVIASDMLEHPRLVQEGETGCLFDWQSPESLADAVTKLHELAEPQYQEMCGRARRFAEENLSVVKLGDAYEALFRQVAAARAGGAIR